MCGRNNEVPHYSPNRVIKSRRLRWAGHVARIDEIMSVFKILTDTPTGKRHLGRSSRRYEENIRIGLKEIGICVRCCVEAA